MKFTVVGQPKPAGALTISTNKAGTKHWLRHSGDKSLSSWKGSIAAAASESWAEGGPTGDGGPTQGAVAMTIRFYAQRPLGHFGTRGLRPSAPRFPTKRSVADVDKLARAVLDALAGIVYFDDSQVVNLNLVKRYADGGAVRAEIEVEVL